MRSSPITEGGERKPKFSLCITLENADADADADGCDDGIGGAANGDGDIEKRNLSEEFFTASERPKP